MPVFLIMKRKLTWRELVAAITISPFVCSCPLFAAPTILPQLPEAKHGLHFTNSVTTWDEAIPLGSGILGALLWGNGNPVRISLDRTDLWDLTPVPEFSGPDYNFKTMRQWHQQGRHDDLVRVYEKPYNRPAPTKIPAGRIEIDLGLTFESTHLDLLNAEASMRFKEGWELRTFICAASPLVGFIQLLPDSDTPPTHQPTFSPKLIPPPFGGQVTNAAAGGIGAGDLAQLGYPHPIQTSGPNWQAYTQQGALGLQYATYLEWRRHNNGWIAAWTILASTNQSVPLLHEARQSLQVILSTPPSTFITMHRDWWQKYWSKSTLTLPNPTIERQWFLDTYKFGAASRRLCPPITLQGPWTADDGQLPPWKGDYHHDLNTQLSYWPCYSGNRLEEGLAYLDWLWNTREACREWTQSFFQKPGLNVPMTADLNNHQIGGWRQYTHSSTTAAWLAQHFYWHWQFSQDLDFLQHRAYPYLKEASIFLEAMTREKTPDGKRNLPLSSSPEIHDNRPQAWFDTITNYDLALIRWLWTATAELASELQLTNDTAYWQERLKELPNLATTPTDGLLVAKDAPLTESHRHFSHLMAIHPLGILDVEASPQDRQIIESSLAHLLNTGTDYWCGYSFAWLSNMAARALNGQQAAEALEIFSSAFTLRNSFHCNGDQTDRGYSKFRYRPFTLEGNFAAASGTQEMLLQSHRGIIQIFPAIPPGWQNAQFTTLRARGGILVSAQLTHGQVTTVILTSEKGGPCRLKTPASTRTLSLNLAPGQTITLTAKDLQ